MDKDGLLCPLGLNTAETLGRVLGHELKQPPANIQKERQTNYTISKHTDRETDKLHHQQTYRQRDRQADYTISKHTERETDRQITPSANIQTERQTGRLHHQQTYKKTERQTYYQRSR